MSEVYAQQWVTYRWIKRVIALADRRDGDGAVEIDKARLRGETGRTRQERHHAGRGA